MHLSVSDWVWTYSSGIISVLVLVVVVVMIEGYISDT
jgi:hypothetical protein